MIKLKKLLKEGYAWERDENGALPTLESSTAKHAKNVKEITRSNPIYKDTLTLDPALLKKILQDPSVAPAGDVQNIKQAYYAIADNLPTLVDTLRKVHENMQDGPKGASPASMEKKEFEHTEVKTFEEILTLFDLSSIGNVL